MIRFRCPLRVKRAIKKVSVAVLSAVILVQTPFFAFRSNAATTIAIFDSTYSFYVSSQPINITAYFPTESADNASTFSGSFSVVFSIPYAAGWAGTSSFYADSFYLYGYLNIDSALSSSGNYAVSNFYYNMSGADLIVNGKAYSARGVSATSSTFDYRVVFHSSGLLNDRVSSDSFSIVAHYDYVITGYSNTTFPASKTYTLNFTLSPFFGNSWRPSIYTMFFDDDAVTSSDITNQTNSINSTVNNQTNSLNNTLNSQTNSINNQIAQKTEEQTEDLTNGYDNSQIVDANTQLAGSMDDYEAMESQVSDRAGGYIQNVEFFDPTANTSIMSGITLTGSFLQSLYANMHDWSAVILVSLSLTFALMLIGWFKFRR